MLLDCTFLGRAGGKADLNSSLVLKMLTKLKDEDEKLKDRSAADLDNLKNTDWVRSSPGLHRKDGSLGKWPVALG